MTERVSQSPPGRPSPERLGRYEISRRLAVGGMAEIFLGHATGIGGFRKTVVLKRILPHLAEDEEFIGLFLAEARLTADLQHPHIAQVFDVDKDGEAYFFAMEYVAGRNLHAVMEAARGRSEALDLGMALAIAIAICKGLHHAHERRDERGQALEIVHRDVSPSNVLISWDGNVKLTDFGIARASSRHTLTQQGILRGKLAYMSPEQIEGKRLDRRSDIYAMGTLLYEMTTGMRPFSSEDELALSRQIPTLDVPPPSQYRPDYPPDLERIVLQALRIPRDDRQQTAQELQLQLEQFARKAMLDTSDVAMSRRLIDLFPPDDRTVVRPSGPQDVRRERKLAQLRTLRELDRVAVAVSILSLALVAVGILALRRARQVVRGLVHIQDYELFDAVAKTESRLLLASALCLTLGGALTAGIVRRVWRRWRKARRRRAIEAITARPARP